MSTKKVELPPGCIITDRRTWDRQQRIAVRLEAENRKMAERLQLLVAGNEALRRRIAETEEIAVGCMMQVEEMEDKLAAALDYRMKTKAVRRALRLARNVLERVLASVPSKTAYGGEIASALRAVKSAESVVDSA